jgi:NADH-quinone oxidoreductase subunit L
VDQLILISLVALGLPLLSFVLVIFNQKQLGEHAYLIATPAIAFSAALSAFVAWTRLAIPSAPAIQWGFDWLHFGTVPGIGLLVIRQSIFLDNMTVILMVVVTGISLLVHVFSIAYMKRDPRFARYFAFLGLFTFAMLGIVLAGNFLQLYIFWELVGFSSYVLIAHYYEKHGPQNASRKAFITNRIGDAFLWTGILLLFSEFHTFDFRDIFGFISQGLPISFSFLGLAPETTLTVAGLLIFGGAIAKSAQFPLHIWLPDAMEGPTPVSALIHAATMVAAGVYLMARVFPLLTSDAMLTIACTGAFTSFMAATIAIAQRDIKKILAYSTISQLGLMMMSIGSGAVAAGVFHLVTHAAFKGLLFLGAGSVIYAIHHAKDSLDDHETNDHDIFNMGRLIRKMPLTGWTYLIATLAITGLPLTAGFMSKDEILAGTMAYGELQSGIAQAIPWIGFGVTLLTAVYMWRQVFLVFFGKPAIPTLHEKIKESPKVMTIPLIILAVLTLWFWYGNNPMNPDSGRFLKEWVSTPAQIIPPQTAPRFLPHNYTPALDVAAISPMPHQIALHESRITDSSFAELTALASALCGFIIGWYFFLFRRRSGAIARKQSSFIFYLSSFLRKGWYLDTVYHYIVVDTVTFTARAIGWFDFHILDGVVNLAGRTTVLTARIAGAFDKYVVDGFVTLVGATVQFFGLMARSIQTGRVQTYLTWVVAAVVVILVLLRFSMFHL